MNQNKKLLTRVISLMLSMLMMVSCMSMVQVTALTEEHIHAQSGVLDDGTWSGTTSGLVADNYALNDVEKAVLNSKGLAGDVYTVAVPDDSTGLVSVDADAQVITAKPYETNGFVWVPTLAVVVYSANGAGDALDVELNKVGDKYIGTFTKPANSYSVRVIYTLNIPVDAALQSTLINTPYYLADGYIKLKDAVDGSLAIAVSAINEKMAELRALYNGIKYEATYEGQVVYEYTLGFKADSKCKEAIGNLIADFDKPENNSRLTLSKDFDDYRAAQSKIKFMLENGATIKEHINWFYTQLATINAYNQDILDIAAELENLANGTGAGTIADAKNKIDELADQLTAEANTLLDEKIQTEIIKVVVDTAKTTYNVDISSLNGKTRKDDAIYKEITATRATFEKTAKDLESLADFYKIMGNPEKEKEYRDNATLVRTEGNAKLDQLDAAIREAYRLGDEKIAEKVAEVKGKKADLDALGTTALEKAADIRDIVNGTNGGIKLSQVVNTVKNYRNQTWDYLGKKLVRDDITDEQYLALDSVVKTAIDPILEELLVFEHEFELKSELFATETEITSLVEQYSVSVEVKASAVSKTAIDSKELIPLDLFAAEFPMDKNTSAADVVAAIVATGVEDAALASWDSYYNVGTENYNRTVTVKDKDGKEVAADAALTSDVVYTIEYTPKNYTITEEYKPAGEKETTVPYGYRWCLPRPSDVSKSYDYVVDGVSYLENSVVRVTKNIVATREEGKALTEKTIAEIIAMSKIPGTELSAKEKAILNSGAIKSDSIFYRQPENKDALATVEDTASGYKVVAKTMTAGIVGSEAVWTPVSAVPVYKTGNGEALTLVKNGDVYEAEFAFGGQLLNVQVVYQLAIDVLDSDTVSKYVNVGGELVAAAAFQKGALDTLCTKNNFYKNLEQVTSTVLGTVGSAVPGMSPAAKVALNELTSQCINENTTFTYLYEYLTQYMSESGGLSYLYKGDNAANIIKQISLVNKNLPIMWNDAAVQAYINSMPALASQSQKVEAVMAQLKATNLPPVNALVNTNSAFIDNLIAIVSGEGETSTHNNVSNKVVLEQTLSAAAPGQLTYAVEIEVLNKNGDVVDTLRKEGFVPKNTVVSVAELEDMYAELYATIADAKYYTENKDLPTADVKITTDTTFTSSITPLKYTVKIDGEADQYVYAFDAYTITLPGTGVNGFKYIYNVGNKTQEVGTGTLENYSLGTNIADVDALFGADRVLEITREKVDINKDNFIKFIGNLNKAFANAGFEGAAFIPYEDAKGNLSIVLRVTSTDTTLDTNKLADELVSIVTGLSYVGLNNSPLFGLNSDNEVKLYVQSIINMIVNSGLSLDTIVDITNADGTLKEFKVKDATVINTGVAVSNLDKLGAKLFESSMQFGVNINNATSAPLYVTFQDYGTQAKMLKEARKGVAQIGSLVDVTLENGAANLSLNLPDSVYAYLVTAMLATGEVDFETIQSYDLEQILAYWLGLLDPMFENDTVNAQTFINTIEKTGLYGYIANYDTEANKALIDLLFDVIDNLFDNTGADGQATDGLYEGVLKYDAIDSIFNKKPALSDYANMVAEKDTGIELPVTVELKNRDVEYQALVLDIETKEIIENPKGTVGEVTGSFDSAVNFAKKYHFSRDIVAEMSKLSDGAIVIMLADVHGNITTNKDVIINLNGYTINGDITSKGVTTIVDSTLTTSKYGSVTGKLVADGGDFKLGSGKFASGAEKYLESGYYYDNAVVTNGCYSIEQDGEDLNVYLGTDYMSLDRPAVKVMATDLVFKLIMNYYECSKVSVDSNTLYALDARNLTSALDNPSAFINDCLGNIDSEGCSAFATQFMKDVTDFGKMADAVENKTALVEYSITNNAFEPYMAVEGNGKNSFLSVNLKASEDNKKVTNLNVYVANTVDADNRAKLTKVLRELDAITTVDNISVELGAVKYANKSFSVEGSATANAVVDLSSNVNYPVIIAAIVADGIGGKYRTELINAIRDYQTKGDVDTLKKSLEKVTVAQMIVALKNTQNKSFAKILSALGLTAPDAVELESLYTVARKAAGTALQLSKKHGNGTALSAFKTDEYGVYSYTLDRGADTKIELTLKLFTQVKDIIVKDSNGIITMNTDILSDAIENAADGNTIYVNNDVTLDKDVEVPGAEFAIVGADKVTFGAYKLIFKNGNTKVTVDKDITAYTTSPEDSCSQVVCTQVDGKFVYTFDGEYHDWVDYTEVEPDCENDGHTAYSQCSKCKIYKDGKAPEVIDALGHLYEKTVVAPTCTEEGYTSYTCSRCNNDSYVDPDSIVPPTNHVGTTQILEEKAATCTEDGLTEGLMCTECNTIIVKQETIPAAHKPEIVEKEPNCTEDGYTGKTVCTVCGTEIEAGTVIPATGHNLVLVQGTEATCTETGLTAGLHCSKCTYVQTAQEIIPAKGHIEVIDKAVEATCTSTGLTEGSHCAVCKVVLVAQNIVPKADHTPVIDKAVEATCTSTGLTEGSHCKYCDTILVAQQETPKADHTVVVDRAVEATCTTTGLTEGSHCSVCGEVFVAQKEVAKKDHTVVIDKAVEPTCKDTGLTQGSHCAICGEVFVAQKEVAKKDHIAIVDKAVPATCLKTGLTEGSHCGFCGEVIVAQKETPLADHKAVEDKAVAATKDKTGLTAGSHCSVCGEVLVAQKETAKLAYINVPTVKVDVNGNIRGAKVDAKNNRIYLDVAPTGFTAEEFDAVNFVIDNATESSKSISKRDGSAKRGAKDLVCTGDVVTVTAKNKDGVETTVTYTIIIMGDSNCDGKLNARDLVLMKLSFVGDLTLAQPGLFAADMNFDGKVNARDTVACETKYLLWSEKQYNSYTK